MPLNTMGFKKRFAATLRRVAERRTSRRRALVMIGHRSRAAMLERLVQYMNRKPGVWFATHEQIANHVKPQIAQK